MLIRSCISGYLGCFHFLATVNMAAMNMGVKMSLLDPSLNSFEYILMIYISLMVVVLNIFFYESVEHLLMCKSLADRDSGKE